MSDAAALRAKRRRDRILLNSEDRMKKIFGGQNYHENHLTITESEMVVAEEDSVRASIESLNFSDNVSTEKSRSPTVTKTEIPTEQKKSSAVGTIIVWLFFGCLVRMATASEFSWMFANQAFLPYAIFFVSTELLADQSDHQNPSGVLEIVAQLAGVQPAQIHVFKRVLKTVINFTNTFSSYFIGLTLMEIILQLFF